MLGLACELFDAERVFFMPRSQTMRSRVGAVPLMLGTLILLALLDALLLPGDLAKCLAWCLLTVPLVAAARILKRAFR
jgi:hypothetical protein